MLIAPFGQGRCADIGGELHERVPIHLQREHVGGASNTTLRIRRAEDQVENLQLPEERHRDDDDRHRFQEGERDPGKHAEGRRPIDLGRLPVILRNRGQPGRIHDEAEPRPEPDGPENEANQERRRALHPADGKALDPDGVKELRHDPDRAVVKVEHENAANDERRHHPDENRGLDPGGALHVSKDKREPEAEKEGQGEVDADPNGIVDQRSERRRLGESVQVDRVGASEHLSVVRESRELAVGGEEADSDRGDDRVGDEKQDQEHGRNEENEAHARLGRPGARPCQARLTPAAPEAAKELSDSFEPQSSHYADTFA